VRSPEARQRALKPACQFIGEARIAVNHARGYLGHDQGKESKGVAPVTTVSARGGPGHVKVKDAAVVEGRQHWGAGGGLGRPFSAALRKEKRWVEAVTKETEDGGEA